MSLNFIRNTENSPDRFQSYTKTAPVLKSIKAFETIGAVFAICLAVGERKEVLFFQLRCYNKTKWDEKRFAGKGWVQSL